MMTLALKQNLENSYNILQKDLLEILEKDLINKKEYKYRKNKLVQAYTNSINLDEVVQEYRSIMHEILAIKYVSRINGELHVTNDHKNESGIDFIYNNNLIECKICTFGDIIKKRKFEATGILDNSNSTKVIDYNEPYKLISERIYSSIKTKRDKYLADVAKNVLNKKMPFILWIDLGDLAEISLFSSGIEGAKLLNGLGYEVVQIESEKGIFKSLGYEKQSDLQNKKGTTINRDIFGNIANSAISGIILSSKKQHYEDYDISNTHLYINYNANNKINLNNFEGFNIWGLDDDGVTYKMIKAEE